MKVPTLLTLGLAAATHAQVEMDRLMKLKTDQRNQMRAQGAFNMYDNARLGAATPVPCVNGKSGPYSCDKVDMLSFLSHSQMGSSTKEGNDIWGKQYSRPVSSTPSKPRAGWTSPDGREFGAVGQTDGTAFVEIAKAGALKYLGRLPTQTDSSIWRDMKVVNGYVYIGSEAANHGLQVFDMRKVRCVTPSL